MKKLLVLSLLFTGLFLIPGKDLHANNTAKKTLCIVTGLGSLTSFAYWCRPTFYAIKYRGWKTAFKSTLIPRLMVDASALALSVLAFNEFNKK